MKTALNKQEQEALLTIALMAAFADGGKSDFERSEIKRITESLGSEDFNLSALYQRVLLRETSLTSAAAALSTPEARNLAYEMAVCICEADDLLNEPEKNFLEEARRALGLDTQSVSGFHQQADAVAQGATSESPAPPILSAVPAANGVDTEVDKTILHYAILNGALELLPQSLATMAIVPLQMKMVYRIGKRYGHDLDRRHISELLGAAGVGLTSQVVEGFAQKLLGGLLGKFGGGMGRRAGNQIASSAMSFASTYALGQVAQRYYSGGRQLSSLQLKELFTSMIEQARSLHDRYAPEIRNRANNLNPAQLMNLVR